MAGFEVDIFKKCVEVDLHNYSIRTALIATREKIKEAYEHGFRYIRLIHGAANIMSKNEHKTIKYSLRTMLKSGEFDKWIDRKGSFFRDESLINLNCFKKENLIKQEVPPLSKGDTEFIELRSCFIC